MSGRLSEDELQKLLDKAATKITVGAMYRHYKDNLYKVTNLVIHTDQDDVCVIYQAHYGRGITFARPLDEWLETVEVEGKSVERFTAV